MGFEADVKSVSPLYDCGNGDHLMIVALAGINEEGYIPMEQIKEELRTEVIRDKKAEQLIAKLSAIKTFDEAKALTDAVSDSVKHVSFATPAFISITRSSEPALGALASTAELNKLSKPFKGNGGVFVIQPYNRTKLDETFDEKTEENRLSSMNQNMAGNFISDLYQKAEVKDMRYLFF